MDQNTRKVLLGMVRHVHAWMNDRNAGSKPSLESLVQAESELLEALYPDYVTAQYRRDCSEERPVREMSDREEYIAAHACGRIKDAEALREGRF